MPVEFPRLKLQMFDYGLGGDESIGETTLSIRESIMILNRQGQLEDKKIWVSFTNPNKPLQSAGYALISLQILTQHEAENNPVGEA